MQASESKNWRQVIADCLAASEREQVGSRCPVVDHEVIASAGGDPDELVVWCICRTREERQAFVDSERARFVSALRKRMLAAGVPESIVDSLVIRITSREEVEANGGRFIFF